MIRAYKEMFARWNDFSGRSGRDKYWLAFLMNMVIGLLLYGTAMLFFMMGGVFSGEEASSASAVPLYLGMAVMSVYMIYSLVLFIPGLALSIRRLHDTGKSGWFLLVGLIPFVGVIILIVFYATRGNAGPNAYGPPNAVGATPWSGQLADYPNAPPAGDPYAQQQNPYQQG